MFTNVIIKNMQSKNVIARSLINNFHGITTNSVFILIQNVYFIKKNILDLVIRYNNRRNTSPY